MASVEIKVSGDVAAALQKAKDLGANLTIPFNSIARSWFKSNQSIFALQGPGKYQDLSPKYKIRKIKKYGKAYPIMKAEGRLERSLTDPTDSESVNLIVNNNALYLGTRVPYAVYHQSDAPRKKIPYRPVVFVGVEQLSPQEKRNEYTRMFEIIDAHIQQVLEKALRENAP